MASIKQSISKFRVLLTRKQKYEWGLICLFALINSLIELATAFVIIIFAKIILDPEVIYEYLPRIGIYDKFESTSVILWSSVTCGLVYLIKNTFNGLEIFLQNYLIKRMIFNLRTAMLNKYIDFDYRSFISKNSAYRLSVVMADIFNLGETLTAFSGILSDGIVFIVLSASIIYLNPASTFVILGIALILFLASKKLLLPLFYRWGKRLHKINILSNQYLLQFFHAFKEVILLNKANSFVDQYKIFAKREFKTQALVNTTNQLPRLTLELTFVGLFTISIAYLSITVKDYTEVFGILAGYLYVGFRIMPSLNRLISKFNTIKATLPYVENVYKEYTLNINPAPALDLPKFEFNNLVSFKTVSFSYSEDQKTTLKNISLTIKKGQKIGVVGTTGSGKSTLIDLLLGLLKPQAGDILVDDNYSVNSIQWRSLIGYVPQSIYLIDNDIEANITFDIEGTTDRPALEKAIEDAQLSDLIVKLPEGIKTIVGERGVRLSGGERQRVAIARALYRNPSVLIFDEATSALDNKTEARLMKTIDSVSENKTVVMIAHRLTSLRNCDSIIVLKEGEIEQITTYDQIAEA